MRVDLDNETHSGQFIAWTHSNTNLYLSIKVQDSYRPSISAIELYLLNNPDNNVGVPSFQLYRTTHTSMVNPLNIAFWQSAEELEFIILDNHLLSKADHNVRKLTFRLLEESSSLAFLFTWSFASSFKTQWIAISEVKFCGDEQLPLSLNIRDIQFLEPLEFITALIPPAYTLKVRSLDLICTVSTQGSFVWEWTSSDKDLEDFIITYENATRTSVLTIRDLDFQDTGTYSCEASHSYASEKPSQLKSYSIHFPSKRKIFGNIEQ